MKKQLFLLAILLSGFAIEIDAEAANLSSAPKSAVATTQR